MLPLGQLGPDQSEPTHYTCRLYYGFEGIGTLTLIALAPFLLRTNRRRAVVVAVGLFLAATYLAYYLNARSAGGNEFLPTLAPAAMGASFLLLLLAPKLTRWGWLIRTVLATIVAAIAATAIARVVAPGGYAGLREMAEYNASIQLVIVTATIVSMRLFRRRFRLWVLYLLLPVLVWTIQGAYFSVVSTPEPGDFTELFLMTGVIYVISLPALLLVTFSRFFRERFLALFGIAVPAREANEGRQPPSS